MFLCHVSYSEIFHFTRVTIVTCRTLETLFWHVFRQTLVSLCKMSLETSLKSSMWHCTISYKLSSDTCEIGHVSNCTNFVLTRAGIETCHTVQYFILHLSHGGKHLIETCRDSHLWNCVKFILTRLKIYMHRAVQNCLWHVFRRTRANAVCNCSDTGLHGPMSQCTKYLVTNGHVYTWNSIQKFVLKRVHNAPVFVFKSVCDSYSMCRVTLYKIVSWQLSNTCMAVPFYFGTCPYLQVPQRKTFVVILVPLWLCTIRNIFPRCAGAELVLVLPCQMYSNVQKVL